MEWVEITGKTVEEAKEAALDELGVDEHDAEFEILEEPKAGLFGRLRSEARVRARVLPTAPAPKVGRRDRRQKGRRDRAGSGSPRPAANPTATTSGPIEQGGDMSAGPEQAPERADPAEVAEVAVSFLDGLLRAVGAPAELDWHQSDDDTVEVRVGGEDLGLLIGHRGQTLAAVQDLTRTVVQRKVTAPHPRVIVDIGSYRVRRREALTRFASEVAAQVTESGVPVVLEPMVAADRKVVHDTVAALAGVTTTSEGEEPNRRIVIVPQPRGD